MSKIDDLWGKKCRESFHNASFDTAATTLIAPEVLTQMVKQLGGGGCYANPSSTAQLPGQAAAAVIAAARSEIATELGCEADEVIFTSGATEANNLALRGIAFANARHGRHLVTSAIEQKPYWSAVLRCSIKATKSLVSLATGGWIE